MASREEIILALQNLDSIKSDTRQAFVLNHTYDVEPRLVYLTGPYTFDAINTLIAYIQYESSDLDEVYGMDQSEVAVVLVQLYGCELSETPITDAQKIDLYLNWEEWCGLAREVQSIKLFKNERLSGMLQGFIDKWKAKEMP